MKATAGTSHCTISSLQTSTCTHVDLHTHFHDRRYHTSSVTWKDPIDYWQTRTNRWGFGCSRTTSSISTIADYARALAMPHTRLWWLANATCRGMDNPSALLPILNAMPECHAKPPVKLPFLQSRFPDSIERSNFRTMEAHERSHSLDLIFFHII